MSKPHALNCPVAGMANIFGDHWTWLLIREAFGGATRFTDFRRGTGIAKNLLSDRLAMLVRNGILEKRDIGANGVRYSYHLTDKGRALETPMVAMFQWGSEHLFPAGQAPVSLINRKSGAPVPPMRLLDRDGQALSGRDLKLVHRRRAGQAPKPQKG